jgi:AcrR family transcriptional regulator
MLASTATLMRERGASATTVDDVLAHSGAPRGSVYHHFPGGRAQLVAEAVRRAGGAVGQVIDDAGEASALATFDAFLATWRENLRASDYRAGCPVLAVAVEAGGDTPELASAAADAFALWRERLATLLRRDGASPAQARRLATLVVASIEGGVALSRVERDLQPLDDVGRELRVLVRAATGRTDDVGSSHG